MWPTYVTTSPRWLSRVPDTIAGVPVDLTAIDEVLQTAARIAGVDATSAVVIRDGSHVMYRLRGDVVARVGRPGTAETAEREVAAARWLATAGLSVTRTIEDIAQPVVVDDRPVTWWRLLPEHRAATPAELGSVLRALHAVPMPTTPRLPTSDPVAVLDQLIVGTPGLDAEDRGWLVDHVADLRARYRRLPLGEPRHVIHGDAWQDNVAVPAVGAPILLDLEHISIGHPDWDLIQLAVDYADFARIDEQQYRSFVHAYGGYDVTETPGFRILADIQELRWTNFVIGKSASNEAAGREVRHRIACLRGAVPRPWAWTAF
jgi:hypothetical protein